MAAIEERFQAAVNVIKGLPKNGPYQPSTSMMLKFYGLFKQATEGGCDQKKPGFWDIECAMLPIKTHLCNVGVSNFWQFYTTVFAVCNCSTPIAIVAGVSYI